MIFFQFCLHYCALHIFDLCTVVPGAPPRDIQGRAVDSRSIQVSWRPPEQTLQHGDITQYHIKYMANEDLDMDQARTVSVPAATNNYTLDDLHKWTLYSIWMFASTVVGDGPYSEPIQVRTAEAGMSPAMPPFFALPWLLTTFLY